MERKKRNKSRSDAYQRRYKKRKRDNVNDYAIMLSPAVKTRITKNGGISTDIDHDVIRAVMQCQKFMDPISKQRFVLPSDDDVLKNGHPKWNPWVTRLSDEKQALTPVIERRDKNKPWVIGNILFISKCWESSYRYFQSLPEFMVHINAAAQNPPHAPTYDQVKTYLDESAAALAYEHYLEAINDNKIQ